jgi:argininosuccinate lyase
MSHIRGRLVKKADSLVVKYTSSLPFDWRLYRHDIAGSSVHARMLVKQGIISSQDGEAITTGLAEIAAEIEQNKFNFKPEMEDIHMAIEARLLEKTGTAAARLHTARSRNDQVALDMRLFTMESIDLTREAIKNFQRTLLDLAEANQEIALPGYSHLQPAQPVLLAHHLLSYFEMLSRDDKRFKCARKRADVLPLGSGALAGVVYDIDQAFLAKELGFANISRNSLDAVADRDFVLDYLTAASVTMMHLSRLAEEIVLWSSAEFSFIELDDAYATTSSIMPQKKNPDVAELARGKTGRVYGNLMAMLTTMKALPLAYNRDLQEDKEGLFDTVDTLLPSLDVMRGLLQTLKIKGDNMHHATQRGYLLATDLADYLVGKGEAFRNAHGVVGRLVIYAAEKDKTLNELTLDEYRRFSPRFEADIFNITLDSSLAARNSFGGTAPKRVATSLGEARKRVNKKVK